MQPSTPFRLLVLLLVCALSACEKVALTAPTGSTITIALSSTNVPINGSIDVIATVLESSGTPAHNGTLVTFTGSFGRFEPAEAITSGGVATVKFVGTSSGTTKITAISGPAKVESGDVKVGGAAAGSVAMRAEPATLPQGGGTTQVTAVVRDPGGNILPGAPVNFTSDQGNLGSTAAVTDENGEARVSLTTNRDTVVTATVISGVTATTTVRIINAPTVQITTSNQTPGVGVGVNFTVTPGAITNGASIQNVTINWGDGSPEQNLGAISGATNVTHTFNSPGSYTVVATATDATGQRGQSTLSINVQRIAPNVTITASPTSTFAGGVVTITVSASAAQGGAPIQSVTVRENPGGAIVYSGTSGGSFTRTLTSPGTYTFTATATDTGGTTGTAATAVSVGNAEATLTANGAGLVCSGTPVTCTGLVAGTNVTFTANITSTGVVGTSYEWHWGDGSPAEVTTARINSHVFPVAGSYVVQVTITTNNGGSTSQVLFIRP